MANTEQLNADYVRAGIRSAFAKLRVGKAKVEVEEQGRAVLSTLHEAAKAQGLGRSDSVKKYSAAKRALKDASRDLVDQKEVAKKVDKSHGEAFERLKAAQKEAGPAPETPFQFQFAETVKDPGATISRSNSKRYKFETEFDSWLREVNDAFADYSKIEVFPSPPGKCRGVRCAADKKGHFCRCRIEAAFSKVDDIERELKRWHPSKFAACAADKRKLFEEMAEEIFTVVSEMIQEQRPISGRRVVRTRPPRPSRLGFY